MKTVAPPVEKERCSRCGVVLGDIDKAMEETSRLWRAINGMDIDDADKRAEHVMRQSLDGLSIGPENRASVKALLAEHFAELMART
jgi:hypothetical protein